MGLTVLNLEVANPRNPQQTETVEFLIDSGAIYSVVPRRILDRLGINPVSQNVFRLASGQTIERQTGGALFKYGDKAGVAAVIFGEESDSTLLGAHTLESLIGRLFSRCVKQQSLDSKDLARNIDNKICNVVEPVCFPCVALPRRATFSRRGPRKSIDSRVYRTQDAHPSRALPGLFLKALLEPEVARLSLDRHSRRRASSLEVCLPPASSLEFFVPVVNQYIFREPVSSLLLSLPS